MSQNAPFCLDLNFQGQPQSVAVYMFEHSDGIVLVETGPGSTLPTLEATLKTHGYGLQNITHVLLTHIHLDHAGASGALAQQGAQILVHPVGAPHLLDPSKLIVSATRIYGDLMDKLWGETLPVPSEKLTTLQDEEEIVIGHLRFTALDTPGHAEHHYCFCFDDLCLSGDVGAVRIPSYSYLRVPMPPPEFYLEKWRESVLRLQKLGFKRIAPTHFGIFDDAEWHFVATLKALDDVETWMMANMPSVTQREDLKASFIAMMDTQARALGLDDEAIEAYRLANPLSMSVDGMARYWKKYRTGSGNA